MGLGHWMDMRNADEQRLQDGAQGWAARQSATLLGALCAAPFGFLWT